MGIWIRFLFTAYHPGVRVCIVCRCWRVSITWRYVVMMYLTQLQPTPPFAVPALLPRVVGSIVLRGSSRLLDVPVCARQPVSYELHWSGEEAVVRLFGTLCDWAQLHYARHGTANDSTEQHGANSAGYIQLHIHRHLCYRDGNQGWYSDWVNGRYLIVAVAVGES